MNEFYGVHALARSITFQALHGQSQIPRLLDGVSSPSAMCCSLRANSAFLLIARGTSSCRSDRSQRARLASTEFPSSSSIRLSLNKV